MIDAWGKIPEGILSGHVNSLGDFDECLGVRAPEFRGQYCDVWLFPSGNFTMAYQSSGLRSARKVVTVPELLVSQLSEKPMNEE